MKHIILFLTISMNAVFGQDYNDCKAVANRLIGVNLYSIDNLYSDKEPIRLIIEKMEIKDSVEVFKKALEYSKSFHQNEQNFINKMVQHQILSPLAAKESLKLLKEISFLKGIDIEQTEKEAKKNLSPKAIQEFIRSNTVFEIMTSIETATAITIFLIKCVY